MYRAFSKTFFQPKIFVIETRPISSFNPGFAEGVQSSKNSEIKYEIQIFTPYDLFLRLVFKFFNSNENQKVIVINITVRKLAAKQSNRISVFWIVRRFWRFLDFQRRNSIFEFDIDLIWFEKKFEFDSTISLPISRVYMKFSTPNHQIRSKLIEIMLTGKFAINNFDLDLEQCNVLTEVWKIFWISKIAVTKELIFQLETQPQKWWQRYRHGRLSIANEPRNLKFLLINRNSASTMSKWVYNWEK